MNTRKEVKKITVEFEDGTTKEVEVEGMFYKSATNYPGGSFPNKDHNFISHEVRWTTY